MSLAGDGLPTRGQVGYEIFDQQSNLGATSFVQNINNVRALEGEGDYYTIGEVLDRVIGKLPLDGRRISPRLVAALDELPR